MSRTDHPDSIRNDVDTQTLSRYVMSLTKDRDFVILMNAIQTSCKLISRAVRKAGIASLCKYIRGALYELVADSVVMSQ